MTARLLSSKKHSLADRQTEGAGYASSHIDSQQSN